MDRLPPRPKRVFISVPRDHNLREPQRLLKRAVLAHLRAQGLEPQEFQVSGLPVRAPYTIDALREIMTRCHGVLVLAFSRWHDKDEAEGLALPTVWNHFEGAFAIALKKEILVITEQQVSEDGITWGGGGQIVLRAPRGSGAEWLATDDTRTQLSAWVDAVKQNDDIFLAYSSKARATANDIHKYLVASGVAVRDWELNFAPGPTILEELVQASRSCLGAVMLLTRDDELATPGAQQAVPRDNVIFEMGMFMEAKGRERVLVVLEEGAKLPADIGGGIYLQLKDRNDITPIHSGLSSFVRGRI
ncbi:MAG: nucleotide-binding protein [Rubrivivax sp.]|nr:nucleotide-binding protein [Rubrivivax sp.]